MKVKNLILFKIYLVIFERCYNFANTILKRIAANIRKKTKLQTNTKKYLI